MLIKYKNQYFIQILMITMIIIYKLIKMINLFIIIDYCK